MASPSKEKCATANDKNTFVISLVWASLFVAHFTTIIPLAQDLDSSLKSRLTFLLAFYPFSLLIHASLKLEFKISDRIYLIEKDSVKSKKLETYM